MSAPAPSPSHHDTYHYTDLTRVGPFGRLLWYSCGADAQLLARCPYSDRVKFQGLGGVVLATALLAFASGSYAFYVVFSPKSGTALADTSPDALSVALSCGFGLLWSLIIFNIDRFIVASTGKGDGTDKITLRELSAALPRIAMALIIGICLSAPLEIRILKTEIDTELAGRQKNERIKLDKKTDERIEKQKAELIKKIEAAQAGLSASTARLDDIKARHDQEVEKRRQEILTQRRKLEEEIEGLSGSGVPGRGRASQEKEAHLKQLEADLDKWDKEWKENRVTDVARQAGLDTPVQQDIDRWKKELDSMAEEVKAEKAMNLKAASNMDGLMMRIHISHEVGGAVPWVIMLLLLSIEIGPIFFKMMLIHGAYDYMVENQKRLAAARYGIEPAHDRLDASGGTLHIDEVYHAAEAVVSAERERLRTEIELTRHVHEAYRAATAADIASHPERYLETSESTAAA